MLASFTFVMVGAEETKLTINVEEAGSLPSLITEDQINRVTDLTLTGKLNSTDIKLVRRMAGLDEYGEPVNGNSLQNLDFSGADIVSGGEPYYYTNTTSDNIIGDSFFENATQLKSVKISTSAIGIEWLAFSGCSGLTDFVIPDKVDYLDQAAFGGCSSLETVTFGNALTTVDGYAFKECTALKEVVLPESLKTLGEFAFYDCTSLKSAYVPSAIDEIGQFSFSGCSSLDDLKISDGVKTIGNSAFAECTSLQSLVVPNSVTEILESAFDGCTALTSLTLPDNITEISEGMLSNCSSLQTVKIPKSVSKIGESAFLYDENLLSLDIPDAVTEIGEDAFFDCEKMTNITLGSSLQTIGEDAFKFCEALENINVSDENNTYTSVDGVLYDKGITTLLFLPSANTEEYTVPSTVKELPSNCAITNMKLRKVVISDNVETIGDNAFQTCTNLESVTIGSGVAEVGEDVFFMDENLKEIHSRTSVPLNINKYFFWDVDYDNCKLYVPKGSLQAYSEAEVWKDFKFIEEEATTQISSVTSIQDKLIINGKPVCNYSGGEFSVVDTTGKLIYQGCNSSINIASHGLYIVMDGDKVIKVNI